MEDGEQTSVKGVIQYVGVLEVSTSRETDLMGRGRKEGPFKSKFSETRLGVRLSVSVVIDEDGNLRTFLVRRLTRSNW